MHGLNHVRRRGAIYVWRRRLPKSLEINKFLQVSLRTKDFSSANFVAALVNRRFMACLPKMQAKRISVTEAQHLLAAEVAHALKQIEEYRYFEPEIVSPDEWRARYFEEKCRAVALRMVASRGRGACILEQDRSELAAQGFSDLHLEKVDLEIENLQNECASPEFEAGCHDLASNVLRQNKCSAADARAVASIRLKARAIALERSDRRSGCGPYTSLDEDACIDSAKNRNNPCLQMALNCEVSNSHEAHGIAPSLPETNKRSELETLNPKVRNESIEGLITQYLDSKGLKNHSTKNPAIQKRIQKNARQRRSVLKQFEQSISASMLSDLSQSDLAQYDWVMDNLPKNHGKSLADRKRTVHELIERATDLPSHQVGLAGVTKNRNFGIVQDLLKFARKKYGIEPEARLFFQDLHVAKLDQASRERHAFTDEDVKRLASSHIWASGGCPRRDSDGKKFDRFGLYWLPIIADLTGARREEIAGMRVSEVVLDHEIPHFDIRPNENRLLKNTASERCVPIHDTLRDLGFFDYVEGLRKNGKLDLFPDLKPRNSSSFGDVFYKEWKPIFDQQLGEEMDGKVFHSFRHRFITLMRHNADISKDIVQDIVGHTPQDETDRTYRNIKDFRNQMLRRLNPAIQSVSSKHWCGMSDNN